MNIKLEQTITRSTIKSFVLRKRKMSHRQQQAFEQHWSVIGIDYQLNLLNLPKIFKRKAPIILEIGFGMGQSLVMQAKQNLATDFIGIEVYAAGVGSCLADAFEAQLTNLKIFYHDAVEVLKHCIPDSSLARVQLFFPDPWPKTRHHKRRIVQPQFIQLITRCLAEQGILYLATDWHSYAEYMLKLLNQTKGLVNLAVDNGYIARLPLRSITKFEQRGITLGHKVWDLGFIKN